MDKKVSPTRQKKEQIVAKLADKITKAKGLVFTNYQGLTHRQLEELKKKLKAANAELVVTKNTLLLRALENGKWKMENGNSLKGPTATLFLYTDPIEPLKQLVSPGKAAIKFGILEGEALTGDQVLKIAALPPYEALLTQLVVGLKAPILGLHRSLLWNIQKFVMTLSAIQQKKS